MERVFNQALRKYCNQDYYPWHMPGHKRQSQLDSHNMSVDLDMTEVAGLDNLLMPEGVLAESMQQLSRVYESCKSYYLVNGSTCGILTAISAVCNRGDTIIMSRNCHKSVYHAVALLELRPIYLYPNIIKEYGICNSVAPGQMKELLKQHPEAKAVIVTSPTYEGIVSDIRQLSDIAHQAGAFLIVDEAHGAHLEFGKNGLDSAVRCGADLVVESLHKTLPCYTQCGILHIGHVSGWADLETITEQVERFLNVYQSSSPSYLLVANMEEAIASMNEWRESRNAEFHNRLSYYRNKWKTLKNIHLLTSEEVRAAGGYAYDETKLVFCFTKTGINGQDFLRQMEEKYGMILEMATLHYALAMTTVADTEEAFQRLDQALASMEKEINRTLNIENQNDNIDQKKECMYEPDLSGAMLLLPGQAWNRRKKLQLLTESEKEIAGDYISLYPPGIPILVPGERIEEAHIEYIGDCLNAGLKVQGLRLEPQRDINQENKQQEVYINILSEIRGGNDNE